MSEEGRRGWWKGGGGNKRVRMTVLIANKGASRGFYKVETAKSSELTRELSRQAGGKEGGTVLRRKGKSGLMSW